MKYVLCIKYYVYKTYFKYYILLSREYELLIRLPGRLYVEDVWNLKFLELQETCKSMMILCCIISFITMFLYVYQPCIPVPYFIRDSISGVHGREYWCWVFFKIIKFGLSGCLHSLLWVDWNKSKRYVVTWMNSNFSTIIF